MRFLFTAVAVPTFIIFTVLSAPAMGAELVNDHFFTAGQLKKLCQVNDQKCGAYVFGVLDTLISAIECNGAANQLTSNEVAHYLNHALETTKLEILNKVSGASMVAFAFSQTTVNRRCVAEGNGI